MTKIPERAEQLFVSAEPIFVLALEADSAGIRGVELGSETVYSPAERSSREANRYGASEREDVHQSAA